MLLAKLFKSKRYLRVVVRNGAIVAPSTGATMSAGPFM